MLVSVLNKKRSVVYLEATPQIGRLEWNQSRSSWIGLEESRYRSKGYEPLRAPSVAVLGEAATCIAARPVAGTDVISMQCVLGNGSFLASYDGSASRTSEFTTILSSLRKK